MLRAKWLRDLNDNQSVESLLKNCKSFLEDLKEHERQENHLRAQWEELEQEGEHE